MGKCSKQGKTLVERYQGCIYVNIKEILKEAFTSCDIPTVWDIQQEFMIEDLGSDAVKYLTENEQDSKLLDNLFVAWPGVELSTKDIGSMFVPVNITALPEAGWVNIAMFNDTAELADLNKDHYKFKDTNDKTETFPPSPKGMKYKRRIVLKDSQEFNRFLTDLKLRLSDWRITYKNLSE